MQMKLLDINLLTGEKKTYTVTESIQRKYIGGRGLGAKLLLDLLPAGVDPLGEENVVIWLCGPLTGSLVPGCTKHAVITKSPVSGGYVDSYSSAGIGTQLVYAGFYGLIVRGRANNPVYLYIKDNEIEIRDATAVWGKEAYVAAGYLEKEINEEGFGHSVIGPAGENLVNFACINNDYYRQAGRGGIGAVMGSKNLKAIIAKGTGGVAIKDSEAFFTFHKAKIKESRTNQAAQAHKMAGTSVTMDLTLDSGMVPTRNFKYGKYDPAYGNLDSAGYVKQEKGSVACLGCPVPCGKILECHTIKNEKFRLEGPEYETAGLLGTNLEINDLNWVAEANMVCDQLGLDTISAGNVIGFLMEATENGLIPPEFSDQSIRFGEKEKVLRLLKDIAFRRGIGDWAADGVKYLAEKFGHNSSDYAMHSKGLEFPAYDPRRAFGAGLAYAVSPRGACHRRAWPPKVEVLGDVPPYTVEGKEEITKDLFNENTVIHSLVACDFPAFAVPISMQEYAMYLKLVTGMSFTLEEFEEIAERIETTIRYFNSREGLTAAHDTLPKRVLEEPLMRGPAEGKKITTEGFNKMLKAYYKIRGWDKNGIPLEETLRKYIVEEN